jgi:hypothetical protein
MKKLFGLLIILLLTFALKSEAKPIKLIIKIDWGSFEKGICNPADFGICRIIISLRTTAPAGDSGSEVLEAKGEIANNMLLINLPKGINEKGRNARGQFAFTVPAEMVLDQALARELGVERLSVAPGNYEFKGNMLALKIQSPRDPATGQATGKRVLPTVNK